MTKGDKYKISVQVFNQWKEVGIGTFIGWTTRWNTYSQGIHKIRDCEFILDGAYILGKQCEYKKVT